mgnify:CR=1 FL=1
MSSLYKKLTVCCLMLCMLTGCAGSRQAMSGQADVVDETTERTDTERADTGKEKEPDIVCWGDSLTYGTGGEGVTYPSVLADETGLTVYNYGVCGEKADQIAVRMGLYPMTTGAFTIPAEREPVALSLLCDGEDPIMLRLGDAGMNPCDIAGVKGELSYSEEDGLSNNVVKSLLCDKSGNLWIATNIGLNIYRNDSGSFHVYRTSDGLPFDDIFFETSVTFMSKSV